MIYSVKSGGVGPRDVRDLHGVIVRAKAAVGVLITLEGPTADMRAEAAEAGDYVSSFAGAKCPRLQIITIEDLLSGKCLVLPPHERNVTFKPVPKAKSKRPRQAKLFGPDDE